MKVYPRMLALVAVALLGAACGGGGKEPPAQAGPTQPAPKVPGVRSAPPPAWIETRGGNRWLAFFGYCWSATCVDFRPLEQRTDVPRIRVVAGEVVRFHLGFRPTELTLKIGSKTYPLKAQRVADWRVQGGSGIAALTAHAEPGSAGYVARLLVR